MGQQLKSKKYELLQKELKRKVRHYDLSSSEVVKVSQQIDQYILKYMREKNNKLENL